MRRAFANRVDNTAKELIAYAQSIGFDYVPVNGVIDGVLIHSGYRACCVDWKSPGGTLTDAQAKLVARGVPITFIHKPEQLDKLHAEMSR